MQAVNATFAAFPAARALIKRFEYRIMAHRPEGPHVQGGPHVGASPQMVRVPRRVPLSRVKGATPPRAASRWRLSVPTLGGRAAAGGHRPGQCPAHGGQLLALTPDRTRAQGGVQVVVERREALIEPGARHLDIGLETAWRATEAVLFGGPHADQWPPARQEARSSSVCVSGRGRGAGRMASATWAARGPRGPLAWLAAPWRWQSRVPGEE